MSSITVIPHSPPEIFRRDYKPCDYKISEVDLFFDLAAHETAVVSTSRVHKAFESGTSFPNFVLEGEELKLQYVKINGVDVNAPDYTFGDDCLIINGACIETLSPNCREFSLETKVLINPIDNTALSGLYSSSNILCTQCEANGFRRISYYQDRPDVLAKFTVRLEGDKDQYPVLLSNGNLISSGLNEGNTKRHWAVWKDPFLKPSYLFAIVAGSLGSIHDTFTTASGRTVQLGIYSSKENVDRLHHAMYSLKKAMSWDEEVFGLECDLDIYNIVATDDFNMGAMENKGLNIFNAAYVLADPSSATDLDYENILRVIAHEYFHNWTGNRVTVRDWFQLTLKEGLTVFRDQWFTSDMTSVAVKRIEDVLSLRNRQFSEDKGPLSHPIRPESYVSMDNFYTATVYQKGAEVVRMYRTVLGEAGFKAGMKLYFERHDGGAVTCDDFRAAMADANSVDLTQFEQWYTQSGTPLLTVSHTFDPVTNIFSLALHQSVPSKEAHAAQHALTSIVTTHTPLFIPVSVGLLHPVTGRELHTSTVMLREATQTFHFPIDTGADTDALSGRSPVVSVLRDFSAPVKLRFEQPRSEQELAFLMTHDTDSFNRWEAANELATEVILTTARSIASGVTPSSVVISPLFLEALRALLTTRSPTSDLSLLGYSLQIPDESTLLTLMPAPADVDALHAARGLVQRTVGHALNSLLQSVYDEQTALANPEYIFSPEEVGRRRLINTCLDYLCSSSSPAATSLAKQQFDRAARGNMTLRIAALAALASNNENATVREEALAEFFTAADGDALLLNKWFAVQSRSDLPDQLERVKALMTHPSFTLTNPNRARSLLSTFAGNHVHFHALDGRGYAFIADAILTVDAINPQVAARLTLAFSNWREVSEARQALMVAQLQRIQSTVGLSKDTLEIASRCLK